MALGDLPRKYQMDPLRMLHELQVHKIELELQNEELISANRELDALRLKYQSFYDEAPVGYLSLSLAGEIVEFNACAARLLKREAAALTGMAMRQMFTAESQAEFDALLRRTDTGELAVSIEHLLIQRPASVPVYVRAQARRKEAAGSGKALVLLALMDVTALKFATDDVISTIRP